MWSLTVVYNAYVSVSQRSIEITKDKFVYCENEEFLGILCLKYEKSWMKFVGYSVINQLISHITYTHQYHLHIWGYVY